MEGLYTGLHQPPEKIAATALQEDVDVVALSILSGAHNHLFPKVIRLLKEKGADDIQVFGGGILPDEDIVTLKEAGVLEMFTPGASMKDIIEWVRANIHSRRLDQDA